MNLEKTYWIELYDKKNKSFIQYIEANDMEEAIKKAKNSFFSALHGLGSKGGSSSQKACKLTILKGKLRFGFNAGWITLDASGLTIFEVLKKAENHPFTEGKTITEITNQPKLK